MSLLQNAANSPSINQGQKIFSDYPDLLTIDHLHELTGLSGQTLRREVAEGRLPGIKIGRRIFVPKFQLVALFSSEPTGE